MALIAIVCGFSLLRLAKLEADFPWEITEAGTPFTDEGWYANAAVRTFLSGNWHLTGDINEAIVQPTFHVIQYLNFQLFEMSLGTARLPGALAFCGLTALVFFILRAQIAPGAGLLAALLLATDFHLFAYSRIAIVEIPMLFLVSMSGAFLYLARNRWTAAAGFGAGISYAAACLTKPSAFFALPALVGVVWLTSRQDRWRRLMAALLGFLIPVVLVYGFALAFYREDVAAYFETFTGWSGTSAFQTAESGLTILAQFLVLKPILSILTGLSLVVLLTGRRALLSNGAFSFLVGCLLVYFLLMSIVLPHPTRYFVPLIAICAILSGAATSQALAERRKLVAALLLGLLVGSAALGASRSIGYLVTASESYLDFCNAVAARVRGSDENPVLMGNLAPQISLATGLPGISAEGAPSSLLWLLRRYRPTHFVSLGEMPASVRFELEQASNITLLEMYELSRRGRGIHMHLYELDVRVEPERRRPSLDHENVRRIEDFTR